MSKTKVSTAQKEQIVTDFRSGEYTKRQLAVKYGISHAYACRLTRDDLRSLNKSSSPRSAYLEIQAKVLDLETQRNILETQIREWTIALKALESIQQEKLNNANES